ncbi:MAG: ROK family transcriptional regulator [Agathobacter sp.]|nr:ROK family transcriptional regulator [Agathobacter sp.]
MKHKFEGINQENVKQSNRSAILKLLCSEGAMSRKDIAQIIGLTPAAVTLICSELMEEGVLVEKGEAEQEKRAGRRKILVDINYGFKKVLCIRIEVGETYLTLTDLAGNKLSEKSILTDRAARPEAFLENVATSSKNMMWEAGVAKEDILAGGVSVTGIVDRKKGISKNSFQIWDEPVDVKSILEEKLGVDIVVENNVKACAYSELIYGDSRSKNNLMFVKWGPGVGSAITIDHHVYQGRDFRGAEIGHYIVEKNGIPCRCGKRGCLETVISSHAFVDEIKRNLNPKDMPKLIQWLEDDSHELNANSIVEVIGLGDEGVRRIMDEKIDRLARTVENIISVLNPDNIIVYGTVVEVPGIFERFIQCCQAYDPDLPEGYIKLSGLGDRITYRGPLAVAMDDYFV